MMGNACYKDKTEPSTDSYGDKLLKYVTLPVVSLLGVIAFVVLYLVDKVKCYQVTSHVYAGTRAEVYCFNTFRSATNGSKWSEGRQLMHKNFPILLLCQCLSFILLIIFWYWCLSRDLSYNIRSVIDYCNNLTEYFRKYDKGMRKVVTEATLHREIDNYMEYLLYLLMTKAKKIYINNITKWVSLLLVCCAWFSAYFVIILPNLVIFEDMFYCLYDVQLQMVAQCSIPSSTFLRAVWYINQVLLGLFILVAVFHIIELCQRDNFSSTFFYRALPGMQDSRLAECIDLYYNPRYFSLISRFCDSNIHLCKDAGLSKSLARKYGVPNGLTPGGQTIVDKHYPVIQPEQLRKFRESSEKHYRSKEFKKKKLSRTVQVHPNFQPKTANSSALQHATSGRVSTSSVKVKSSGKHTTSKSNNWTKADKFDQSMYMTSRLLGRKLEKDLLSIRNSKGHRSINSTPRSQPRSDVRLDDLSVSMSTPRTWIHRNVDNKSRDIGNYPTFTSRSRELNPFAYNLDYMIRKNIAANLNKWKP